MLTDKQEAFIHFEKNKLSDTLQDILDDLLEAEKNSDDLHDRLELAEVLLSECLEILTFLARKKANRVDIKETMATMDLSNYAGGHVFDYEHDKDINNLLKILARGVKE